MRAGKEGPKRGPSGGIGLAYFVFTPLGIAWLAYYIWRRERRVPWEMFAVFSLHLLAVLWLELAP